MKVKELKEALEKIDGRIEIVIALFGKRIELEFEDFVVMDEKHLVIAPDEGHFISTPFTSDNE